MTVLALTFFGVVVLTLFGIAAIADRSAAHQPRKLSSIDEWVLRTPVDELADYVRDGKLDSNTMHRKLFPGLRPRTKRPPPPPPQGGSWMHRAGLSSRQLAETLDSMSTVTTGLTVDERRKAAGMPPLPPPTTTPSGGVRMRE